MITEVTITMKKEPDDTGMIEYTLITYANLLEDFDKRTNFLNNIESALLDTIDTMMEHFDTQGVKPEIE